MIKNIQNQFVVAVDRITKSLNFSNFINEALVKYDIKPYKITKMQPLEAKKVYLSIHKKYQKKVLSRTQNDWYQNQRKIYIWFLLLYCFQRKKQPNQLESFEFQELSNIFFGKNIVFLEFQSRSIIRNHSRLGWENKEDVFLIKAINLIGKGKWNQISKMIYFQSNKQIFRSPKQCRQRYLNHLDENKSKKSWTEQEDQKIFSYVAKYGKKWAKIVPILNQTRTEHMIKNRYVSLSKKTIKINKQTPEKYIIQQIKQKQPYLKVESRQQTKDKIVQTPLTNYPSIIQPSLLSSSFTSLVYELSYRSSWNNCFTGFYPNNQSSQLFDDGKVNSLSKGFIKYQPINEKKQSEEGE